jgi:uncharacterized protein YajQ (UPF0234 family)
VADSSFDIVSKVEQQELRNALDAARKELTTRFDFKGAKTVIEEKKDSLHLEAPDEMKMKQLIDIVQSKLAKRELPLKAFKFGEFTTNVTGVIKCDCAIQNGLSQEQSKKITKLVKDSKLKVQANIQGDKIRVTGKSRDDLQSIIAQIKAADFDFATAFENYK